MEGSRVCRICNRSFSNGKAMGGHMRSHFAKVPPRLPQAALAPSSPLSLPAQQLQEKPQTLVPPAAHVLCSAQSDVLTVHDRGSDTESSRRRKRNRSQRRRRHGSAARVDAFSNADVEQTISSVSETETLCEANGALCLMMLSRDKWPKRASAEADEHEDDSVSVTQTNSRAGSSRPRYRCETCNKGFGSYQALGGHRASHKRMRDESFVSHNHKILAFECPFCHKVFDSGQALGGHKKVHNEAIPVTAKSKNCGESLIDLNLPAPEENGEETTASLVEISSVSNEETSYPIKKRFLQV